MRTTLLTFSFSLLGLLTSEAFSSGQVRDFGPTLKLQYRSLDRKAPSHILVMDLDLSDRRGPSCEQVFFKAQKTLNVNERSYFNQSRLLCRQQRDRDSAEYLRVVQVLAPYLSAASHRQLKLHLQNMTGQQLYGSEVKYQQVKKFVLYRILRGVHSFRPYRVVVAQELRTEVKSVGDIFVEKSQFFSQLDLNNRDSYVNFLNRIFVKGAKERWLRFFSNAFVDVLKLSPRGLTAVTSDEEGEIYLGTLLQDSQFIDTRWDEFLDDAEKEESGSRQKAQREERENFVQQKVCVKIDTRNTHHPDFPNMASNVFNHTENLVLDPNAVNCFDYAKTYYMQRYLPDYAPAVWYGTTCRYLPFRRHNGLTLVYDGEHGGYKCPVRNAQ